MDIDIGSRMIIEFSGKERMNCLFAGMSKDEFILLRVPLTSGIRERLAEGMYLQFRYLKHGKIISFGADVMRYQAAPASVVFISYPTEFSEYNLRKEGRVECRFPAEISVDGKVCSGLVVDISPNGCKFVYQECDFKLSSDESAISGWFTTMEGDKKYEFNGGVKALQSVGSDKALGIRFEGDVALPDLVQQQLKMFEELSAEAGGEGG